MSFLSPLTALLALGIAVPLLLGLYVLKLRRRIMRIASTLLWQRSFDDLQVNAPFQRLRLTPLFLLQLLALVLFALALAEPVIKPQGDAASRMIVLIDRSASMSATDATPDGGSRLDAAKAAAREVVDRVLSGGGSREVMVIAFGRTAQLISGFESRRDVLRVAIDSITPTDEEADLAATLELAATFGRTGEGDDASPPDVVLVSDGGVAPPERAEGFSLRAGNFRYVAIGPAARGGARRAGDDDAPAVANTGIVSLSARRDYNEPSRAIVFARLVNCGPAPVETFLTLHVDGEPGPIETVTVPPAAGPERTREPGAATVTFSLELSTGAVLSVRQRDRDALAADDTAAVVLPAPARPRIALVFDRDGEAPGDGAPDDGDGDAGGADPYLRELIAGFEPRSLREMSLAAYEREDPAALDLGRTFDLVVFDSARPSRLPAVPTITFGAAPPGWSVTDVPDGGSRILSWPRQHAIMRHVALDTVVYAGFGGLRLPSEATALATGPAGPVIAVFPARGAQHVVVGFALRDSNWPTHVSVAVFLQNALDYLTLSRSGQTSLVARPGEPVTVRARGDATRIEVTGPRAEVALATPAVPGGTVTLPLLRRVGLYTVEGAQPPHTQLAVSMLSTVESDIRPAASLAVNGEPVLAGVAEEAAPRDIWSWFAAAALVVLVMEWLVYCRRLRG